MFNFSNVVKLIENQQGNAAYIFFFYSYLLVYMFSPEISIECRLILLEIAYEMICNLLN